MDTLGQNNVLYNLSCDREAEILKATHAHGIKHHQMHETISINLFDTSASLKGIITHFFDI